MPQFVASRYLLDSCKSYTSGQYQWCDHIAVLLQSDQVSRLVKVHGIIISATAVKAKATKVCLKCRGCRNVINNIPLPPGLQGYALPRKCNTWVPHLDWEYNRKHSTDICITLKLFPLSENPGQMKCPVDPYFIIPDRCICVDFQTLRLQESPDAVPHGEMPRHLQLYCDRWGQPQCCLLQLHNVFSVGM